MSILCDTLFKVGAQQLLYYYSHPSHITNQIPTGGAAYAIRPSQTLPLYRQLPAAPVAVAPAAAVVAVTAPGTIDPAFVNTPAIQQVDTALALLNQQLPAINRVFNTLDNNKLVTTLLGGAARGSSCPLDTPVLGRVVNQFIAVAGQSRAELAGVVEAVQKMARNDANDAAGAVRATSTIIDAIEPLVPRFRAILPPCSAPASPPVQVCRFRAY